MTALKPQASPGQATQSPAAVYPPPDVVLKVCPDSPIGNINKYLPYILKAMASGGMTSKNDLIAVLATIYVETTSFAPIEEVGRGGGAHGVYFGRGFLQITHLGNYRDYGKVIGVDLVKNPERALDPEIAAKAIPWFFKENGIGSYIQKGDYDNVRSIVNAGKPGRISVCWGVDKFRACVRRGKEFITQGIDPASVGALPLDGSYGLGCADPGSGSSRTITGVVNPANQSDAASIAWGLHQADRAKSHEFRATINLQGAPEGLDVDVQKTFEVKGFADDLDGPYTCDEVSFYAGEYLEAEVFGYKPDPNAPAAQLFLHNTNAAAGTTASNAANAAATASTTPVPAGAIPGKIYQAALAVKGSDTSSGPEGGNKACAWALNNLVLKSAGIATIGVNPDSVESVVESLNGGRGQKITRAQAVPGDIWVAGTQGHVGICMSAGCTVVLSNSSSKARFTWEDTLAKVNAWYDNTPELIYRVTK